MCFQKRQYSLTGDLVGNFQSQVFITDLLNHNLCLRSPGETVSAEFEKQRPNNTQSNEEKSECKNNNPQTTVYRRN